MGAGLSGIGAACHLQKNCPNKSYAIYSCGGLLAGCPGGEKNKKYTGLVSGYPFCIRDSCLVYPPISFRLI